MVREPVAATVPGDRRDLLALFLGTGHAGFPVVKEGSRKLVGVVTRQDVFGAADESQVALLMNPNPTTTYPEAPVHEAARLAVDRNLRVLPVVTGGNDLVGMLTPAELLEGLPPPRGHVASQLRRRFVPLHQGTPATIALEILRCTRAAAAPVMNDEGRYAGLLTDREILRHVRVADAVVKTTEGLAREGDAWRWEEVRDERPVEHRMTRIELPDMPVKALMVPDAPTVTANTRLAEAARIFAQDGVHHVAVVDADARIVDLLSELDLVRSCLHV